MQGKAVTDDQWDEFLRLLAKCYGCVQLACNDMLIDPRTYYYKRAKDPKFAEKADAIFAKIHLPFVEDALFRLVFKLDFRAIAFYLKARGGIKWNPQMYAEILTREEDDRRPFTAINPHFELPDPDIAELKFLDEEDELGNP